MKNCNHPTCDGPCRRERKAKVRKPIKRNRKPIKQNRKPIKPSRKKIKPFSNKRMEVNKVYGKEAKKYRLENPSCAIKSPVCTGLTEGVHHKKGKVTIELLLDKEHWMPACNACNHYVEVHDAWAREKGYKVSRLSGGNR